MGYVEQVYKTITRLTAEKAVDSNPLSVSAMPIPLYVGDIIFIQEKSGTTYRAEVTSDVAIGDTSITVNLTSLDPLALNNKIPIAEGSNVFLEDLEQEKYIRKRDDIYISFSSQYTASQYWTTLSSSGISNHSWNYVTTDLGTTVGTSTITVPTAQQAMGIVMPFDCVLVGFTAICYRVGNYQSAVGLFCGTPVYNDFADESFTLRAYAAADNSAGPDSNYSQRPVKAEDLSRSFALRSGDIILPASNSVTNDTGNLRISYTIVLRTPKIS